MEFQFDGKKNQHPITIKWVSLLALLLSLENDDTVCSYLAPKMKLTALFEGIEYLIPVQIWVYHFGPGPSSFIGILDPQTHRRFNDNPGILAGIEKHCESLNARYVPICETSLPASPTMNYLRKLREQKQMALRP